MNSIFTHYLHYVGFALLLGALMGQLILHKAQVSGAVARKLNQINNLYGLAALLALGTGLLNVFYYAKPAAYYGHNFIFHIKLTVCLLVFLVSLYPTRQFCKGRNTDPTETVTYPRMLRGMLWAEGVLLLIIPLLGVMMARGVGYTG